MIDEEAINSLPDNSIPNYLNEIIDSDNAIQLIDKVVTDVGPEIIENLINNQEEYIQTFIESDDQDLLQVDRIKQVFNMTGQKLILNQYDISMPISIWIRRSNQEIPEYWCIRN